MNAGLVALFGLAAACGEVSQGNQGKADSGLRESGSSDSAAHEAAHEAGLADVGPHHDAALDAPDPCFLTGSAYDDGCTNDSDCAAVWFGDLCTAGVCAGCQPNAAINVSSTSAYQSDISKLVDGSPICSCPPPELGSAACCMDGVCVYMAGCP